MIQLTQAAFLHRISLTEKCSAGAINYIDALANGHRRAVKIHRNLQAQPDRPKRGETTSILLQTKNSTSSDNL